MGVPTLSRGKAGQRPPASKFIAWIRRFGSAAGRPLFAVILAMIAGGIVIMITASGSPGDRFATVINAFQSLYQGSVADPQGLSFTLVRVGPLIFTGLSVAIAFRAGLFNIGAEGQLAMGAMTAGIIAFEAPNWPGWALIPLMILGSILAGAIWGGIVGLLKAWRGAHEVVTTIMLNWIAFYFTDYLIDGPFKAPSEATQTRSLPLQATLPRVSTVYNATLGTFLPKLDPNAYVVDISIFIALFVLVIYWFITSRTTFGYELRVLGQNIKAARYAGIPIKRNLVLVMALSGAFSGLAGALHLMGQSPYQLIGSTFSLDPTGFDAIGVALVGRYTAIGVLLGSILFGGLRQGGGFMQLNAGIPGDLVYIIQALVLFSIASEFLPVIRRSLPKWLSFSRRPAIAPAIIGKTVVDLPVQENGSEQNEAGGSNGTDTPGAVAVDRRSEQVEEE